MRKHYVTFLSPGTFVAEETTKEIACWDVALAKRMAKKITERHSAIPYGFYFTTRLRTSKDFDSKQINRSPMYYLEHCEIRTIDDIRKAGLDREKILLSNMESNGWDAVVTTTKGWKWAQPLEKDDVVLGRNK